MFCNVLVPLDGSDNSLRAADVAAEIADKFNGKVTLLHVYSVNLTLSMYRFSEGTEVSNFSPEMMSEISEIIRKAGEKILSKGEEIMKAKGIPSKKLLVRGHVVQEIIKKARENNIELIVIGAKGASRVDTLLIGGVSEKVVRNSPCPVLVIK